MESNDEEIKALAKYNLYTGVKINRVEVPTPEGDTRSRLDICRSYLEGINAQLPSTVYMNYYDEFYSSDKYCFYAERIVTNHLRQNEEAKSAHWDADGNYLYPQVGDVYISLYPGPSGEQDNSQYPEDTNFFDSIEGLDMGTANYLTGYQNELNDLGFEVSDISYLPLSYLNVLSLKLSKQSLPYKKWSDEAEYTISDEHNSSWFLKADYGNIKDFIPKEYSWLYGTTYWLGTYLNSNMTGKGRFYIFMAEQGKICGAGTDYCASQTSIGCGIRPVITVKKQSMEYLIHSIHSCGMVIPSVENAKPGDVVSYSVKSDKECHVSVRTSSGKEIESKNNQFIMPDESVELETICSNNTIINPKTGNHVLITLLFITILSIVSRFFEKKKLSHHQETN